MSNGDVLEIVELFLKEEGNELPSNAPKTQQYVLLAIKSVRNETISAIDKLRTETEKKNEDRQNDINDVSKIVRGEEKNNEPGSLVHKVDRNTRYIKGAVWIIVPITLAFLGTIGAALGGMIQFVP